MGTQAVWSGRDIVIQDSDLESTASRLGITGGGGGPGSSLEKVHFGGEANPADSGNSPTLVQDPEDANAFFFQLGGSWDVEGSEEWDGTQEEWDAIKAAFYHEHNLEAAAPTKIMLPFPGVYMVSASVQFQQRADLADNAVSSLITGSLQLEVHGTSAQPSLYAASGWGAVDGFQFSGNTADPNDAPRRTTDLQWQTAILPDEIWWQSGTKDLNADPLTDLTRFIRFRIVFDGAVTTDDNFSFISRYVDSVSMGMLYLPFAG